MRYYEIIEGLPAAPQTQRDTGKRNISSIKCNAVRAKSAKQAHEGKPRNSRDVVQSASDRSMDINPS